MSGEMLNNNAQEESNENFTSDEGLVEGARRPENLKERLSQVTGRWERTLRALEDSNARYAKLEQELGKIKSNHSEAQNQRKSELADVSIDDLYYSEAELLQPTEEESENPSARQDRLRKLSLVRKEIRDRDRQEITGKLTASEKKQKAKGEFEKLMLGAIHSLQSGASSFRDQSGNIDPNSQGSRTTQSIIRTLSERHGEDRVYEIPELATLSVLAADNYVRSQASASSKSPESKLRSERRNAAIPAGGEASRVELSPREKAAKSGDLNGTLENNEVVKSMMQDMQMFASQANPNQ